MRERGIARLQLLLEATEALLQTANPNEIGLYQIAEKAGVPPGSVYHFFPTKEAAYQALAERYLEGLVQMHAEPIAARKVRTWMDLSAIDMRRAMEFYNARPAMLKILYGGYGGVEARSLDELVTDQMAQAAYDRLNLIFHVPSVYNDGRRARVSLAILDAVWTVSVRQYGRITEDYCEEAHRAVVAYRRLHLPEYLEPRELLVEATARDGEISLPFRQVEPKPPAND
jgi:AcrR family transcriptional regulator